RSQQAHSTEDANEAAKEFERELDLDPTNANAAYELADMHRDAGEFEEARQLFEQALKYYPDFEDAHLGLAAAFIAQQKMQDALPHLKKAIALNADNEVSWYRLSQVQMALGNTAERSEEHTSELQSRVDLVCRLLLEKKNKNTHRTTV